MRLLGLFKKFAEEPVSNNTVSSIRLPIAFGTAAGYVYAAFSKAPFMSIIMPSVIGFGIGLVLIKTAVAGYQLACGNARKEKQPFLKLSLD